MKSSSRMETSPHRRKTAILSSAVSPRLKAHFESLVRRRISVVLQMMYMRPDELGDLESGEEYICSVCDFENKRCESEPEYRCETARKLETELKELELALARVRNDNYGICEKCHELIAKAELENKLTRTVCASCAGAV